MSESIVDLSDPDDVAVLEDFVESQEDEVKRHLRNRQKHKHKEHDHE